MLDVVALGELYVDFTPDGLSENGNILFERTVGGAPVNVISALSKLGKKTAFIGKVGYDPFGNFFKQVLQKNHVETSGVVFNDKVNSTQAYASLKKVGESPFSFFMTPGIDNALEDHEIDYGLLSQGKIFHIGAETMIDERSRKATMSAAKFAKQQGLLVSFYPNLRHPLWETRDAAKVTILMGMMYADILKVNEEELRFLTDGLDVHRGTKWIVDRYNVPAIFVTLGDKGSFYRFGKAAGHVPGYKVKTVDTTGAGEAFLGSILYKILENSAGIKRLPVKEIEEYVRFGNAAGALTTTRQGIIPALPDLQQIQFLMQSGVYDG